MCTLSQSLKSLEWRNRGPVATFQSKQVSRNSTKRWSGLKWSVRPRGCTLCRLSQRGLLSSVNTSQSLLQGDPAWIYKALLQPLKSPLWPKHGLTSHHLKVNSEHSWGRDWKKNFLYFWNTEVIHNWLLYGRGGSVPSSQPDNTQIASQLIFCALYGWLLQYLWFCKAALLLLRWDHPP